MCLYLSVKHIHVVSEMLFASQGFRWKWTFVVMLGDDSDGYHRRKGCSTYQTTHDDYERTHASTIAVMPVLMTKYLLIVIIPQGEGKTALQRWNLSLKTSARGMLLATFAIIGRQFSHLKSSKSRKPSSRCRKWNSAGQMQSILLNKHNVYLLVEAFKAVTMSETSLALWKPPSTTLSNTHKSKTTWKATSSNFGKELAEGE